VVPVGPETNVLTPPPASTDDVGGRHVTPPKPRNDQNVPGHEHNLPFADWLFRSRAASVIWLAVRLVLGYWWLNAGYQKIWGSEKAGFWFGGGGGVKGFATAGVLGSATGKSGASYGWWAAFLHNFVIPNASWIAKLIALGELVIGLALIIGLFTGLAALAGLLLNVIYMFTGSAGVNPAYAILEVPLILAWRNAGYLGVDRYALDAAWWRSHFSRFTNRAGHGQVATLPVPTVTH
jgi:thiosulfate dehydrogenase [quinone] large subunit